MFHAIRELPYRVLVMLVNIFFPPLAVMMLTGLGADTALNSLLFLLAVIPSHVHGFYISWVYFWRRRKVRKGRYPGGPKRFITSKDVINGGLSDREVARLYKHDKLERKSSLRSARSRSRSGSRGRGWDETAREMLHRRPESRGSSRAGADAHVGRLRRAGSHRSVRSHGRERDFERERRWAAQVASDGYGPVQVPGSEAGSSVGPGRW